MGRGERGEEQLRVNLINAPDGRHCSPVSSAGRKGGRGGHRARAMKGGESMAGIWMGRAVG